jgi:hypothetical protein
MTALTLFRRVGGGRGAADGHHISLIQAPFQAERDLPVKAPLFLVGHALDSVVQVIRKAYANGSRFLFHVSIIAHIDYLIAIGYTVSSVATYGYDTRGRR